VPEPQGILKEGSSFRAGGIGGVSEEGEEEGRDQMMLLLLLLLLSLAVIAFYRCRGGGQAREQPNEHLHDAYSQIRHHPSFPPSLPIPSPA